MDWERNVIKGAVRLGKKTKVLVNRLQTQEIAVIDHPDLDRLAAESLRDCKAAAVLNARSCLTGKYPSRGALVLLEAKIPVIERLGPQIFELLEDGEVIEVKNGSVFKNGRLLAQGVVLRREQVLFRMELAKNCIDQQLDRFITNTFQYMQKEKNLWLDPLKTPDLAVPLAGRHTLVVVRGSNYKEDLSAIRVYIREQKPVLIGVDGGADALLELGYRPDLVIGDMDSISDRCLQSARQLVVHAYPDGSAPGWERLQELGLPCEKIAAPGTSEDLALLLAYEMGAQLIVAVGTHTNMIDFLEKGRKGMSSTVLTRMKVGPLLVDAKGVSQLYRSPIPVRYIWNLLLAALAPVAAIFLASPAANNLWRLWWMQLRLTIGL